MPDISFVDTTLRDGSQSLWALNMRTRDMIPALPLLDEAAFDGIEFWVPQVQIRKQVKDLHEDPWELLDAVDASRQKTSLRHIGGVRTGLGDLPRSICVLLLQMGLEHGVDTTRISDPWNNFERMQEQTEEMAGLGIRNVVNLVYTVSPRHDIDHFVERARAAVKLNPYRVCLKDVGGLMLPHIAADLMPRVVEACGDVPVEFHSHCNNGMAPFNALIAADCGIRYLHAAIHPLANGSSNPSVQSLARNLTARGHSPVLDLELIREVSAHFVEVAERDNHPVGAPLEFDASMYAHQIPGGMVSNLRHQLSQMGMADKLEATFEEAARVRAEFGYPIMITPLSQFVGTQAAMNVITGQRYQQVTDATIQYALGWFGEEAVELMDPDVRRQILDRSRTDVFASQVRPEPSLEELRERHGADISDRELVLRVCAGLNSDELNRLKEQDTEEAALATRSSGLGRLLQRVLQTTSYETVRVESEDVLVTVGAGTAGWPRH